MTHFIFWLNILESKSIKTENLHSKTKFRQHNEEDHYIFEKKIEEEEEESNEFIH